MLELYKLDHRITFPAPENALEEPSGLLAFGGDLSVERLLNAYSHGIFPWYSEGEPILWWSPEPRGILPLQQFICSKSLQKFIRKTQLCVTLNYAFDEVIQACANIPRNDAGTWISNHMISAYRDLHREGHAQSVEVWSNGELVGGLYGVTVGRMFCGESMFHRTTNASKLATYYLVEHLKAQGATFIDCQLQNPHLESLGCVAISRKNFLEKLAQSRQLNFTQDCWQPAVLTGNL
jgi:leucyl/phenylalanyl-tRNA--protein transferase